MKATSKCYRTCDLFMFSQVSSTEKQNSWLKWIFNTATFKRSLRVLAAYRKNIRFYLVFFIFLLVTMPSFNLLAQPVFTWNGGVDPANVACTENYNISLVATTSGTGLLSYSISGGSDAGLFNIVSSSGLLNFNSVPNYENPTDSDANNIYEVIVRADDEVGYNTQTILVAVRDTNEKPVIQAPTSFSIPENTTTVGFIQASDPDSNTTLTYLLVALFDGSKFSINPSTGELNFVSSPDYENPNDAYSPVSPANDGVYTFLVNVSDGTLSKSGYIYVEVTDVNDAPVITSNGGNATVTVSVSENTLAVTTVTATDDDNPVLSYSISGGDDQALFNINTTTGALTFKTLPDFETPSDTDSNNVYIVTVMASDGSLTDEQIITINLGDVNEAPVSLTLSPDSVREGLATGTLVGNFFTVDYDAGDAHQYYLIPGTGDTDNSKFQIVGNKLLTNAVFNYDIQNSFSVRIVSADQDSLTLEKIFTIHLADSNYTPTNISISYDTIRENQALGTLIGRFTTTDHDVSDSHQYTLVSGTGSTDNGSFQIAGDSLLANEVFNFEAKDTYTIRVRTTDNGVGNKYYEKVFIISVKNINDAPSAINLDSDTVKEGLPAGTLVGNLSSEDDDAGDSNTIDFVSGTGDDDNGSFQISGNQLLTNAVFDFNVKTDYSIRIVTEDLLGLTYEKTVVIHIADSNYTPTDIALSSDTITENKAIGTVIATLTTTDRDFGDTHQYTLVTGAGDTDNGSFQIMGDQLVANAVFNYESKNTYTIRIRTTDNGIGNLYYEESFTITIIDSSEAPSNIILDNTTIKEGLSTGTLIGDFTSIDEDNGESFQYMLVAGAGDTNNGSFQVVGDQLLTSAIFNFDVQNAFTIRVLTWDKDSLTFEKIFNIQIADSNYTPTDISLSNDTITENVTIGTVVGTFTTTDHDVGDSHLYSLVAGTGDTDNGSFQIVGDQLVTNARFNFERKDTYTIRIRTTDGGVGNYFYEETFIITIVDSIEAPDDILLSRNVVNEGLPLGSLVGYLSTRDEDFGESFQYALVNGTGDTDNASFQIVGDQLQTKDIFDMDVRNLFSIRISTKDKDGLTFERMFSVLVADSNFTPTDITLSSDTIAENKAIGTVLATLTTTDPDFTDTHQYALVAGVGDTDNGSFQIVGDQLQTNAVFDYESKDTYTVRIRTTDNGTGNLSYEEAFTISVVNVNETPTDILLDNNTVNEKLPVGTLIGNLSTIDEDISDSHTWDFVAGTGDTDNSSFRIVGNQLQTNAVYSYGAQNTYSIRLVTTDLLGLSFEKVFTITVNKVNDPPTGILLTNNTVDENSPVGTLIGELSSIDVDTGNTHSYSVLNGADASYFTIVGDQLVAAQQFNYEVRSEYSITIRTTDNFGDSYDSTFTIGVTDVNESPVFIDNLNDTIESLEFTLEAYDTIHICLLVFDEDGDSTTLVYPASNSSHGTLSPAEDNNDCVVFTPDTSYRGVVREFIVVSDNGIPALTDTLELIFNVTEPYVNHRPVIVDNLANPTDTLYVATFVNESLEVCLDVLDPDDDIISIVSIELADGDAEIVQGTSENLCFEITPGLNFLGQIIVRVKVQDNGSPVLSDSVTVMLWVEPKFEFSQAISPNNDGINDYLVITGINQFPNNQITIFNRWSDIVYQKDGYDNLDDVWLGQSETSYGSVVAPDGTYFYILQIDGYPRPIKGFVVLKR